jgi:acyl-CoA thioesterase-2
LIIPDDAFARPSFGAMMELAAHGPDTFVGTGPTYPWDGLYGGQIVAQALEAANRTLKQRYRPHSLHAYFLRKGDADEPARFEVERLHDGRSFMARQVVARQSTGAILNMSASFQAEGPPTMDVQLARPPDVKEPEEGKEVSWSPLFELRLVQGSYHGTEADTDQASGHNDRGGETGSEGTETTGDDERGEHQSTCSWFRILEDLGDDPARHAAGLAYVSDSGPAWLAFALHNSRCAPEEAWRPVSLDHAIWFHRPFRADHWLLFEASTTSLYDSRGLTIGRVFSRQGSLVATVTQEVFLRRPREV